MWTRAELKQRARNSMRRNYIPCILVGILLLFALGSQRSATAATGGYDRQTMQMNAQIAMMETYLLGPMQVVWNHIEAWLGGMVGIAWLLLKIFLFNPLEVGGCDFFLANTEDTPAVDRVFQVFRSSGYRNVVLTLFIRDIKILLWGALFVIPGVIKALEYRCVPYLLANNPELNQAEAFRCSRYMMSGEKMAAFILDLSFLLWDLLSSVTFGLAGIFYVNPYRHATNAELFGKLSQKGTGF